MQELLSAYHKSTPTFEDIVRFHHDFEAIHPFQDGNGRVGRLIMFRECLRHNIVPFIIEDRNKFYYYRGLAEWEQEPGYLLDTCRSAQDNYRAWLAYFKISLGSIQCTIYCVATNKSLSCVLIHTRLRDFWHTPCIQHIIYYLGKFCAHNIVIFMYYAQKSIFSAQNCSQNRLHSTSNSIQCEVVHPIYLGSS